MVLIMILIPSNNIEKVIETIENELFEKWKRMDTRVD